jgi:hypothetical protein
MFQEFEQQLQALIASQFLVKVAVGFLCLGESGNSLDRSLHGGNITPVSVFPSIFPPTRMRWREQAESRNKP